MTRGHREAQPDLFSLTRTTDPSTSRAAAADIYDKITDVQAVVLTWAQSMPWFTDRALCDALGDRYGDSTLRTRRSELTDMGAIRHRVVEGVPQYATIGSSGRRHIIWEAVPLPPLRARK